MTRRPVAAQGSFETHEIGRLLENLPLQPPVQVVFGRSFEVRTQSGDEGHLQGVAGAFPDGRIRSVLELSEGGGAVLTQFECAGLWKAARILDTPRSEERRVGKEC